VTSSGEGAGAAKHPLRHDQTALLIVAALFLGLSGFKAIQSLVVFSSYRQAKATVTAFDVSVDSKGTTATTPVVTYQVGRKSYTARGEGSMNAIYGTRRIGDVVAVRYDPSDPGTAVLDSFSDRWLLSIITGVLGVLALGGWGVLWYIRRTPQAAGVPSPSALP
jgi:hypothetical protein